MNPALQTLAAMIACWLNEQQQLAIEYLKKENRVLREQLGGKRIMLNDDQRRRLAVKGKYSVANSFVKSAQSLHLTRSFDGIENSSHENMMEAPVANQVSAESCRGFENCAY